MDPEVPLVPSHTHIKLIECTRKWNRMDNVFSQLNASFSRPSASTSPPNYHSRMSWKSDVLLGVCNALLCKYIHLMLAPANKHLTNLGWRLATECSCTLHAPPCCILPIASHSRAFILPHYSCPSRLWHRRSIQTRNAEPAAK
jgi:hypothetical protein